MVVAEGKNLQNFGIAHQRLEYLNPILQIGSAVDDGLVPRRCLLLNLLAVAKPPNKSWSFRIQFRSLRTYKFNSDSRTR